MQDLFKARNFGWSFCERTCNKRKDFGAPCHICVCVGRQVKQA